MWNNIPIVLRPDNYVIFSYVNAGDSIERYFKFQGVNLSKGIPNSDLDFQKSSTCVCVFALTNRELSSRDMNLVYGTGSIFFFAIHLNVWRCLLHIDFLTGVLFSEHLCRLFHVVKRHNRIVRYILLHCDPQTYIHTHTCSQNKQHYGISAVVFCVVHPNYIKRN